MGVTSRWLVAVGSSLTFFGGCWGGLAAERVLDTGSQVGIASVPMVVVLTVLGAWAERAREKKPGAGRSEERPGAEVRDSPHAQVIGQVGDGTAVFGSGTVVTNSVFNLGGWQGGGEEPLRDSSDLRLAAGWLGRPVGIWGALELEVHSPIVVDGAPTDLPEYIERGHDQHIRESLMGNSPKFIVIVGGSSTGKTRAAYEAAKHLPANWRLHYPVYPDKPRALIDSLNSGRIAPKTVIWLNELQHYLMPTGGEETAAALREYLRANDEVAFIGTIWPEYWQELTQPPTGSEDSHSQSRALLLYAAKRIDMDAHFPPDELDALAGRDARVHMAAQGDNERITQYIAAGPALVEFYLDARVASPSTWAVLSAAMDYCLVEQYRQNPDSLPSFLRVAAIGYMSDEERGILHGDWLEDALRHSSMLLRGATRPLTPIRPREIGSPVIQYRLADYLLQYARQRQYRTPVPASFWDGISAVLSFVYVPAFAREAQDRGMYQQSARLWSVLAQEGDPESFAELLRIPQVDKQLVRSSAIEAIQTLDMGDIYTVGLMLRDFWDYPDLRSQVVERIIEHPQELGIGEPLAMSSALEELRNSARSEAMSIYVHRIHEMIEHIDLSDLWSASSLVEELLESGLEEGKLAALKIAHPLYEQCRTNAGQLAYLLATVSTTDPELYENGIRQLRLLIDVLQDATDTISITPLLGALQALGEMDAYDKLLKLVCSSIGALILGSSYAPFELLSLLQEEGLESAAYDLSIRIAAEFDPGHSGPASHALSYLEPLMAPDVFETFAYRMALEGPILPVAEAENVAECFAEMGKMELREAYLQRLREFRAAEGN